MLTTGLFARPPAPWLPTGTLVAALLLLTPRSGRAEDGISYKFQSWQEEAGRIRVDAHYGLIEKDLTPADHLRLTGVIDTIAGATPTGAPPEPGSDEVPLAQLEERREAWQVEYAHQFPRVQTTVSYANSRESDYRSDAVALNTLTDFNQKHTRLLIGVARAEDDVTARFLPEPRDKTTDDIIIGVTQLVDAQTSATANLTFSRSRGYLSDPYKIVGKTVELLPGLPLALTFPENRPEEREKWILYTSINRRIERWDAAAEFSWRFLDDGFGSDSHTLTAEWFQRLGASIVLRPLVRYYQQSAADFYVVTLDGTPIVPPNRPTGAAPFYSADYRLSAMRTWTLGVKVVWEVKPWLSVDATFERYLMRGRDETPGAAFADANIFTVGVRLWR